MEFAALAIFGTGAIASAAAIAAVTIDRFRKVTASSLALVGGIVPWLFFTMEHDWIPSSAVLCAISIFSSGPLFLVAILLYGLGERTSLRGIAIAASLVGMFAGIGFSAFLSGQLSRME